MNIGDFINFHEQNTAWLGGVCCKVTNYVLISEFVKKQGVKCYYLNTNINWVLRPTGSSRSATLELGINFYPHSEFNPYFPSLSREKAIENNTPTKAFWKRFFFFFLNFWRNKNGRVNISKKKIINCFSLFFKWSDNKSSIWRRCCRL